MRGKSPEALEMEAPSDERNPNGKQDTTPVPVRAEIPIAVPGADGVVPEYQRPGITPPVPIPPPPVPQNGQVPPNGYDGRLTRRERAALERARAAQPVPEQPEAAPAPPAETRSTARLMALDAFRGLTVGMMLLVNNAALGSATPDTLVHAKFGNDPTLADLVFPWFLLAVGVAIPFSAASKREEGVSPFLRILGTFRRAISLYLAGALVDSSIRHEPYIGLGVLQLIALAYLIGRLLYYMPSWLRLIIASGCLGWYGWALTSLTMFNYQPGGGFTEERNFVHYLNENLLAPYRLQGLASVVPTASLVLLGTLVGDILRMGKWVPGARASLLVALGAGLVVVGSLWGHYLPMNKPFWTPPYILYAGGWGILALAFFFLVADIVGGRFWPLRLLAYPMVVFGSNALIAYAGAILVKIHIFQEWQILFNGQKVTLQNALMSYLSANYGGENGGWLYTVGYVIVVWFFCAFLYHKKAFVRA